MALSIAEWFAGGERLALRIANRSQARTPSPNPTGESSEFSVFCRVEGSGPWLTFLHGFPTCSWDWAHVVPVLKSSFRLLLFDFLGFGDSDKPADHTYSLFEQADLLNALWLHFGITETGLVAHDYGSTVAIEQLSRLADNDLSPRIPGAVLLNAGLYVDLQHPVLAQLLLQKPIAGPLLSRFIGESFFNRQFASIFSSAHPVSAADLKQHWSAIVRRQGIRNYHKLIYYLTERRQNKARWERTLEAAPVPLRFIWGLADPVSGKQISDHIRARVAGANLLELSEVGHYPQLEAPDIVAREIGVFFNSPPGS